MASQPFLIDGDFTRAQTQNPPRSEYPFRKNGDRVTEVFEQDYWQTKATFTLAEFSVEHPRRLGFYLIAESIPVPFPPLMLLFTRTWSRVPVTQSVPGSIWVNKPPIPGSFPQILGSSLVLQPDSTQAIYYFYTRKLVTSDSGAPSGNSPTGGTYTVTVGPDTTAGIAYNANAATLQTAINGLASISNRGTVTVTGSYTAGFSIVFAAYAAGTIDPSSLTPGGFTNVGTTVANDGLYQSFNVGTLVAPGIVVITGGTYTITIFGQTTADINYNDPIATVRAAIFALTKVGSAGSTVNPPGVGGWGPDPLENLGHRAIRVIVTMTRPTASASGASLTPAGSTAAATVAGDGNFTLRFTGVAPTTRTVFAAAHGIVSTDNIYVKAGATYYQITAGNFIVDSPDSIVFSVASGAVFDTASTITELGKYASTYTAGSVLSRCKRVSDFYLPGVTPGIATVDDIPLPTLQADPVSLVNAILTGATSINYEVGELAQWRDSPILTRTITKISAAGL